MLEVHEESKGLFTQIILKNIGIEEDHFDIYIGKNSKYTEKVYFSLFL